MKLHLQASTDFQQVEVEECSTSDDRHQNKLINVRDLPEKEKHIVTKASQEIPHPTTGLAQPDLTDEIERDRV